MDDAFVISMTNLKFNSTFKEISRFSRGDEKEDEGLLKGGGKVEEFEKERMRSGGGAG